MKTRAAIIGGGVTGLAAAAWLEHDHGIHDLVVVEADHRPGGKVYSRWEDGHCLEWGPQGFLDNAPDTLELARVADLEHALTRADDASAARYIVRNGELRRVPTSPPAFLTSGVLPLAGLLRLLCEPLARGRPEGDESVFDFARRRIGRQAAETLVDAMVTGVFAGDSTRLSLISTFPRMAAMEREHGSLTRAMLARRRQQRQSGTTGGGGPAGPGGTLTTFSEGMGQLPRQLAERLGHRLLLDTPADELSVNGSRFELQLGSEPLRAEAVLLTTSARASAALLQAAAPRAVDPLHDVPTVPIAVVTMAYRDPDSFGRPVEGFGFLVPRAERLGILGTLFCHAIFPGQAPAGSLLLRTMIGGAREPEAVALDDAALVARVRHALAAVLGRDPDPDRTWIVRHEEGIAQYTLGHQERARAAEQSASAIGVELAGSALRGVSVNDCIRQAREAAARLARRLGS
jgi:oxygen-dependent protoporphyrinogen oxidase